MSELPTRREPRRFIVEVTEPLEAALIHGEIEEAVERLPAELVRVVERDRGDEHAQAARPLAHEVTPSSYIWIICRDCCEAWPYSEDDLRCDCTQDHRFVVQEVEHDLPLLSQQQTPAPQAETTERKRCEAPTPNGVDGKCERKPGHEGGHGGRSMTEVIDDAQEIERSYMAPQEQTEPLPAFAHLSPGQRAEVHDALRRAEQVPPPPETGGDSAKVRK